jgi:hypothetical protein
MSVHSESALHTFTSANICASPLTSFLMSAFCKEGDMKRFSLAELRVVDSDDDSDDFESPGRAAPIERLRSIATSSPGEIGGARRRSDVNRAVVQPPPPTQPSNVATLPAAKRSSSDLFALIQTEEHSPSTAYHQGSLSVAAVAMSAPITEPTSGGDEMERVPHPAASGHDVGSVAAEESSPSPSPVDAPQLLATARAPLTVERGSPLQPDSLVIAPSTDDFNTAHEVDSTTYMEETDSPEDAPLAPPPGPNVPSRHEASPLPRRVDDDTTVRAGLSSLSPHFKFSAAVTPHMRLDIRRHRDPAPHVRDDDSDAESVQFVELGSGDRLSQRELSAVKPCALVLEDGREVTPDPFVSGSDEGDDTSDAPDPQVFALLPSNDWDDAPNTQRGESYAGRLSGRSGTANGLSLYHQRLSERRQAEQRQMQADLELQWQELTFRPEVAQHCDIVHAQPYYLRLHADAAKKTDKSRRVSVARNSKDLQMHRPVLTERTKELAVGFGSDIYERLYPGKPKPPPPEPKVTCGTKGVFARLTLPVRSTSTVPDLVKRQGCTFRPEITTTAKSLSAKKSVVDRLFTSRKVNPSLDATASDTSSVF